VQQYVTIKQLAAKLGVHEQTLYKHQRKPGFPRIQIGRAVRYDPDAVLEWYAKNSQNKKGGRSECSKRS